MSMACTIHPTSGGPTPPDINTTSQVADLMPLSPSVKAASSPAPTHVIPDLNQPTRVLSSNQPGAAHNIQCHVMLSPSKPWSSSSNSIGHVLPQQGAWLV